MYVPSVPSYRARLQMRPRRPATARLQKSYSERTTLPRYAYKRAQDAQLRHAYNKCALLQWAFERAQL